jgi:hypothetical protein
MLTGLRNNSRHCTLRLHAVRRLLHPQPSVKNIDRWSRYGRQPAARQSLETYVAERIDMAGKDEYVSAGVDRGQFEVGN